MITSVPLSKTEEAYVAMVVAEYESTVQAADALKSQRLNILLSDHGVPSWKPFQVTPRTSSSPAMLTYEESKIYNMPDTQAPSGAGTSVVDPRNPLALTAQG